MGRAQDYLRQIASILARYELVPQVTEEMIQQGCKKLRKEPGITTIDGAFVVLEAWMPDRCVRLASDMHSSEDAAQLLRALARATGGEWRLTDVSARVVSETEEGRMEAIDFVSQGKPMRWQYTIYPREAHSDWLRSFEQLVQFFETSLQGTFWGPFLGDQTVFDCYLPRQAAADLTAIQEAMEMDFGPEVDFQIDEGFRAFVNAL